MDKNERFLEVLEHLKIKAYDLEKKGGVKNAQAKVSHYRNGVTKGISPDIIVSLCILYPKVNANYILTGNGSMFLDSKGNDEQPKNNRLELIISARDKKIRELEEKIIKLEEEIEQLKKREAV